MFGVDLARSAILTYRLVWDKEVGVSRYEAA